MVVSGRHWRVRAGVVAVVVTASLAAIGPGIASAMDGTYVEGVSGQPFLLDGSASNIARLSAGRDESLSLARRKLWEYAPSDGLEPRSVQRAGTAADPRTLIAMGNKNRVVEVNSRGVPQWFYDRTSYPALDRVWGASRLPNGNTLVVSRGLAGKGCVVLEIDATSQKRVIWQYGDKDRRGTTPGLLADPFQAARLTNGHTLIVDGTGGGNRIIEVKTTDYSSQASNMGYDDSSIVWQYGHAGDPGLTPEEQGEKPAPDGYLSKPKSAQRLANGDTLIADDLQVVVVSGGGVPVVKWKFGAADLHDAGLAGVFSVASASQPRPDCTILVSANRRDSFIVGLQGRTVGSEGKGILWRLGPGAVAEGDQSLNDPRCTQRLSDGRLLIADQSNNRVIEVGYPSSASVTSQQTDFALAAPKYLSRLRWSADLPAGTSLRVSYSLDGGSFVSAGSSGSYRFRSGTKATFVKYRVSFSGSDRMATPLLKDISFDYAYYPPGQDPEDQVYGPGDTHTGGSVGHRPSGGHGGSPSGVLSTGSGSGSGNGSGSGGTGGLSTGVGKSSGMGMARGRASVGLPDQGQSASQQQQPPADQMRRGWLMKQASMEGMGGSNDAKTGDDGARSRLSRVARPLALGLMMVLYLSGLASPASREKAGLWLRDALDATQETA